MEGVQALVITGREAGSLGLEIQPGMPFPPAWLELTWATRLEDGLKRLNEKRFDIVLVDLNLPDSHGLETFHQLQREHPEIPVVVFANEDEEDLAIQAIQEGAQDHWTPGLVYPEKLLARTLSQAIERKRIELDLERQAREMQGLYETSLEINAQVGLPALLTALVERAARLLNAPMSALFLLQPDGQTLRLEYGVNLAHDAQGVTLQLGEGLSGRSAQTGQTIAIGDTLEGESVAESVEGPSSRRMLAVPLKIGGQVIGVINLSDHRDRGPWTDAEVRLANLFADQAAIAVQNARLLEAERQKSAELARSNIVMSALSQVTSHLGATQKPNSIIEAIGSELHQLGITVLFALIGQNPKSMTLQYVSADPDAIRMAETVAGTALVGYEVPENIWNSDPQSFFEQPAFFVDGFERVLDALPGMSRGMVEFVLARLGLTRQMPVIFLPLVVKEEPLGIMLLWGSDLRAGDLPAFRVFSNQVAVTLVNARLYNHIEHLATTDELTRLYNRRGFFLLGEQQMRLAQRTGSPMLLIFIDVDQLKFINDHFGHKEGDRALITAAEALRNTFRSADIMARISGDEFAVLAAPAEGMGAGRLLERLQHEIDAINARGGNQFSLSVSAGFAVWTPGQSESMDELLARADTQMYQVKRRKTGPLTS